jgi:hypothetical protein
MYFYQKERKRKRNQPKRAEEKISLWHRHRGSDGAERVRGKKLSSTQGPTPRPKSNEGLSIVYCTEDNNSSNKPNSSIGQTESPHKLPDTRSSIHISGYKILSTS